jgi:hypothetical protein
MAAAVFSNVARRRRSSFPSWRVRSHAGVGRDLAAIVLVDADERAAADEEAARVGMRAGGGRNLAAAVLVDADERAAADEEAAGVGGRAGGGGNLAAVCAAFLALEGRKEGRKEGSVPMKKEHQRKKVEGWCHQANYHVMENAMPTMAWHHTMILRLVSVSV